MIRLTELLVIATGIVAGAVASVAGFGIGSLLTPVLGMGVGTKVAVAMVSIPHVVGTAGTILAAARPRRSPRAVRRSG